MNELQQDLPGLFFKKLNQLTGSDSACRVLLAVSGGLDSMVMTRLFSLSGKNFGVAHCNFKLRGADSDLDEQLVKKTALMLGVSFYSAAFDTAEFARENKMSLQEAARELRYQWLQEIAFEHRYDLIATAHHLDDSIETMLINLIRGTGIAGLTGIPEKRGNIIRPLLFATRAQIEAFASQQNTAFRTDQSNLHDKYLRNRLRLHVIPLLKEMNPDFNECMADFFERMKATQFVLKTLTQQHKDECITEESAGISISLKKLMTLPRPDFFIYEFLKDYGFSFQVCTDLYKSLEGQPGARFLSKTHEAIKDREKIFVKPLVPELPDTEIYIDDKTQNLQTGHAVFTFQKMQAMAQIEINQSHEVAMLDYDRLVFPLILRKALPGDRLQPLGMKGSKKISDLLTDMKVPLHEKREARVLVSAGEIVWLAGYRISEKFKIRKKTAKVFVAKMSRV